MQVTSAFSSGPAHAPESTTGCWKKNFSVHWNTLYSLLQQVILLHIYCESIMFDSLPLSYLIFSFVNCDIVLEWKNVITLLFIVCIWSSECLKCFLGFSSSDGLFLFLFRKLAYAVGSKTCIACRHFLTTLILFCGVRVDKGRKKVFPSLCALSRVQTICFDKPTFCHNFFFFF